MAGDRPPPRGSSMPPPEHVASHVAVVQQESGHPALGASDPDDLLAAPADRAAPEYEHLRDHLAEHNAKLGRAGPPRLAGGWTDAAAAAAGTVATVSDLLIYPLKSGRGMSVPRAELTPRGLRFDRCWCVMDPDGYVQDQRVRPMLSMVMPRIEGDSLVLTAPAETGLAPLRLPLAEEAYDEQDGGEVSDRHNHKWFGKPLAARYAGDAAAEWITSFCAYYDALWAGTLTVTGQPSRHDPKRPFAIMRYVTEADRLIAEAFKGKSVLAKLASKLGPIPPTAGFADCAPLHLASYDSLDELNRRLAERGEDAVAIDRFRPNIVVGRTAARADSRQLRAHEEDSWHEFSVGKAQMTKLGDTARCVIPTTNQQTGRQHYDGEPRETLTTYRPMPYGDGPHGGPTFGTWVVPHLEVDEVIVLEVGMEVGCSNPVTATL